MTNIAIFKKSIQTILGQLPQYVDKYELQEKELITEFLAIVYQFENADNNREALTNHFSQYSEKIMKTQEYLITPFLWYTVTVAENAIINLSISRFHALEFYKFLLYQLRGLYIVMKKTAPLSSLEYEKLQIKCEKGNFTLTIDEFELLKMTISTIENDKAAALTSKYIKKKIYENRAISSKIKKESEIRRFYTLVGGKWEFLFNSSSFGLDRVFFHIKLAKNSELKQIIDFKDPDNSVLRLSDVHQVLNSKNEYLGTLLIPKRDISILYEFLKEYENKNDLKIEKLTLIDQIKRSSAFTLYKPDKGWQTTPTKERRSKKQSKSTQKDERNNIDKWIQIIDSTVQRKWSFTEYKYPLDIIKLYCKSPYQFSYSQLPNDKIIDRTENQFTRAEIGILKYLMTKGALDYSFTPWRLVYNFSLDDYWIILPKSSLKELYHFLSLIPYGETYFTNQHFHIWTRLNNKLLSIVKKEMKGVVIPILRTFPTSNIDIDWFDNKDLQWTQPKVLKGK